MNDSENWMLHCRVGVSLLVTCACLPVFGNASFPTSSSSIVLLAFSDPQCFSYSCSCLFLDKSSYLSSHSLTLTPSLLQLVIDVDIT